MIKYPTKGKAFTLIEMLIASTIFAIVVVLSAGVFSSGAKMQQNTKSSINNKELAAAINNKIFDDLKSSNSWGAVRSSLDNGSLVSTYKIKGIAFMRKLTSLKLYTSIDESHPTVNPDLIIGFSGSGSATKVIIYYFKGSHIYRYDALPERDFLNNPLRSSDLPTSITDGQYEIKTDLSQIESFQVSGQNYVSKPSDPLNPINQVQPLINLDLTVVELNRIGDVGNLRLETVTSFSSRNYLDQPQ